MIEEVRNKAAEYFTRNKDLRVLFFFDADIEYALDIDKLSIPHVTILKWENNPFTLKVKLSQDLKDKQVLLYVPFKSPATQEEYQDFPLLGLLLANKELQLDDLGAFMEEYRLGRHQQAMVNKYMAELKYAGVKKVCAPILNSTKLSEERLQQAILSAVLKFDRIQIWPILVAKLATLVLDKTDYNRVTKKVANINLIEPIINQTKQLLNISLSDLSIESLKKIGQSLRYNLIVQTIAEAKPTDPYSALKINRQDMLTQLNQLSYAIELNSSLSTQVEELFVTVDTEIKGERIIENYGSDHEYAVYSDTMLWYLITKQKEELFSNPKNSYGVLEKLSLQNGLKEEISLCISFLSQTAKLTHQIEEITSYIYNSPEGYIHWYEEKGYLIDLYYRRSIASHKAIDHAELPKGFVLDEMLVNLNRIYEVHTDKLNREWLKCMDECEFDYANIKHPKQYDFYHTEVEPVDQKVVVIISDGLRYEVGMELLSEMHGDTKNTAEVTSMLASIPSKTNIGMAQLLPSQELSFNDGDIVVDGIKTSTILKRAEVIRNVNEQSTAVKYENLKSLSQNELRALFKNEVVYVYHDVIDSTGDKKVSERRTFDAVEDAVLELKKFIKSLHATYNVAKVFITADHGFLYADREILDKEKESIDVEDLIQSHNRYVITSSFNETDLGYCFPLSKTTKFKDNAFVTIPNSINRYKKSGVGHQFVHCGGSLQELLVPLIESSRKRVAVTKKVVPQLLSNNNLRVVSNIFRCNILQKEPVSRNEKEMTISIGLYNDLKLVSNEEIKLLNFTSDSPSERMLKIELVLAMESVNSSLLKLKIFDIDDKFNPIIEETVTNNTLIQADF